MSNYENPEDGFNAQMRTLQVGQHRAVVVSLGTGHSGSPRALSNIRTQKRHELSAKIAKLNNAQANRHDNRRFRLRTFTNITDEGDIVFLTYIISCIDKHAYAELTDKPVEPVFRRPPKIKTNADLEDI